MTELKPYRCENCKFYFRNFSDSEGQIWNKCNIGSCQIDVNRQILIDRVGCASHSSIKIDNDNCIWMTAEEEERRIRKDEQDKLLEKLIEWHYDEINRFKLKRQSVISYMPSIKAHENSIKRIKELRQKSVKGDGENFSRMGVSRG